MHLMDNNKVKQQVKLYRDNIVSFLCDLVKIKSLDDHEGEAAQRLKLEMEKVGFDEVKIEDLLLSAMMYVMIPQAYLTEKNK